MFFIFLINHTIFYLQSTIYQWRIVFWMVFGILLSTGIFYLTFADGKIQSWNDPKSAKKRNDSEIEDCSEVKENFVNNL